MIYFIQCQNEDGFVKIGFTDGDIGHRLQVAQVSNPYPLILLGTMLGTEEIEREVHAMFSHIRIRGEWYKPSENLLGFIEHEHEYFESFWEALRRLEN